MGVPGFQLRRSIGAAAAALLLLASACSPPPAAQPTSRPLLVCTILPLAMLARELAGDRVAVHSLLPVGASPHTFEPLPSDLRAIEGASAVVAVGGGLDGWVERLAAATPPERFFHLIDPPAAGAEHGAHGHGDGDPHVWLDPLFVRDDAVALLVRALSAADPAGAEQFAARGRRLRERLTDLDESIRTVLATGHGRLFVSFHEGWSRFAERYGLVQVGVVEGSGGQEPSAGALAALVRSARRARVPAILVEPQLGRRLGEVVAAEFGAAVVLADPLGDLADPARDTYADLMEFNAAAFARALGPGAG